MNIKLTHKRKTRLNHYRRFIVEDGLFLYYISMNFNDILNIRERIYFDHTKDDCKEKTINELPPIIKTEFLTHLSLIKPKTT